VSQIQQILALIDDLRRQVELLSKTGGPVLPVTFSKIKNYDEYLSRQQERAVEKSSKYHRKVIKEFVKKLQKLGDCSSVLCLGARSDDEVKQFIDAGFEAVGVDLFESELIQKCDISALPKHFDRQFDAFVASHTLEHILDFHGFYNGLMKLCRKYLLVAVPKNTKLDRWDCAHYDFMKDNPQPMDIEKYFPGFKVLEIKDDSSQVRFVMGRVMP